MNILRNIAKTSLHTLYNATARALMTTEERDLSAHFVDHQKLGSKALFVFIDVTGMQTTYMGTLPDCDDVAAHLSWNKSEDPYLLCSLVAALDTSRDLKSQWPHAPGSIQSLTALINNPVITHPDLINEIPKLTGINALMTTSPSRKTLFTAATGIALLMACVCEGADSPQAPINQKPVQSSDTKILRATNPTMAAGHVRFNIDINSLGLLERLDIAKSDHLALIFNGIADESGRSCPFFDLKTRDYKVEEIKKDVYRVDAAVSESEYQSAAQKGCIVITLPDTKKIKYLPAPPSPLQFSGVSEPRLGFGL